MIPEDSITFTPDDGEPYEVVITPDTEIRYDGVYTSVFTLTGDIENPTLSMNVGIGDVELIVNGELAYSGHLHSFDTLAGAPSFRLDLATGGEQTIVLNVRYTEPDFYIFPALLMLQSPEFTTRLNAAIVNDFAIPAGISGISFLIVTALFFMSVSFSSPDYSLIFLAFGILSFCIQMLFSTGAYLCPEWLLPLVENVLPYAVAPSILIYIILNRKKRLFHYVLIFSAVLSCLIIAANILKYTFDTVPLIVLRLQSLAYLVLDQSFDRAVTLASNYLILICAASALIYHVRNIIAVQAEKTALESQNRAIFSGYQNMVNHIKKTAEMRHEWKHDLLTLSLLYEQGKFAEIGDYLDKKNATLNEADRVRFTENFVFDVILNTVSAKAGSNGVEFDANLNIPSDLGIPEADLCQLLMNMFDNAFNACAAVAGKRFIHFTAEMKNGFLAINCTNSAPEEASEKNSGEDISHVWGLRNMREICRILYLRNSDGLCPVSRLNALEK